MLPVKKSRKKFRAVRVIVGSPLVQYEALRHVAWGGLWSKMHKDQQKAIIELRDLAKAMVTGEV